MLAAFNNREVRLYSLIGTQPELKNSFSLTEVEIQSVTISTDQKYLALLTSNPEWTIQIMDLRTFTFINSLPLNNLALEEISTGTISFSPDNKYLGFQAIDNRSDCLIIIWEIATQKIYDNAFIRGVYVNYFDFSRVWDSTSGFEPAYYVNLDYQIVKYAFNGRILAETEDIDSISSKKFRVLANGNILVITKKIS